LVRWLEKDPCLGKKSEVYMERVLCNCMHLDPPCWVLSERSPDVKNFQDFTGKYGPFDILARPRGFHRATAKEGGRILEPISENQVRVTCSLSLELPQIVSWTITDSLLFFGVSAFSKAAFRSWNKLMDNWESSPFIARVHKDAEFYEPILRESRAHLAEMKSTSAK